MIENNTPLGKSESRLSKPEFSHEVLRKRFCSQSQVELYAIKHGGYADNEIGIFQRLHSRKRISRNPNSWVHCFRPYKEYSARKKTTLISQQIRINVKKTIYSRWRESI